MAPIPSQEQRDAHTILRQTFRYYGIDSVRLADWALNSLIAGNSPEQILLELEQQPEYKTAFPEIEERMNRAAARGVQLNPISPADILEYRTRAKQLMRSYGLPENFYDSNDNFFALIVEDVSLEEFNSRLDLSAKRVEQAPPEVKAAFADYFGYLNETALFMVFTNVDTKLPELEDMVQAAEAGGAAARFGFGLNKNQAERLAGMNLDYEMAVEGFTKLDAARNLFDETLYETDWTVGDEGAAAVFGLEGGASEQLARRGEARKSETAGSSGAGIEERGVTGLGQAGKK
jgi:hypothetical protein